MPLNKGYPTKNTIVTPKMSHHTLHSPPTISCQDVAQNENIYGEKRPKDIYISPPP
jgi:hypothetical protein